MIKNLINLENKNPTETEKLLFKYYGLYLVEQSEELLKYAPVHTKSSDNFKEFPYAIETDNKMIEWDNAITFDKMSETVSIKSFYDIDGVKLILTRMEELGFKRILTD